MRLRKLALAVGLASVLGSEMAIALGLGEIKLNSTLNQPLSAEIKLLQTREFSGDEILVGLAGKDDFKNAGVDRVFFLSDLKFQVITQADGAAVVKVTSKKPVLEPYLNFLVETQWPTGRILREYTLLMDLPVFSADTAKPLAPAVSKSMVQAPKTTQPRQTVNAPQSVAAKSEAVKEAVASRPAVGDSVQVQSNDTLWEIALKIRPNKQFSVQQTMLAIQRLNPDAFINGNINLLKKGQVLRVPTESHIGAIGSRQATTEVAQQNNKWSENSDVAGPQLEGRKQYASSSAKTDTVEGRLTLASSGAGDDSGTASGSNGSSERLQNELAISLEELDKSKRENSELNERVAELEEQIATMERLVDISSQELRALQLASQDESQNIGESKKSSVTDLMTMGDVDSADGVEPAAADEALVSNSGEGVDDAAVESDLDSEIADANGVDAANKEAVSELDAVAPVVVPQPKEPSIVDVLMENIALIGAALLAILLALFFLFRKRDGKEEVELTSYDSEPEAVDDIHAFDPDEDVEAGLEDLDLDEAMEGLDEEDDASLDLDEDSFTPESETGDAVAEADIYIAYGKFDQAEEMLLKALANDGASAAVSLKLLEVYAETKELDKFDGQYQAVLASDEATAIERANELRSQFTDAPVFDSSSVDTADDLDFDLGDGLDLDTDLALDDASSAEDSLSVEDSSSADGMDDLDLDFNLDFDEPDSSSSSDEAEGFDLDLDLDTVDEATTDNDFALDFDTTDSSVAAEDTVDLDISEDFSLDLDSADEELGLDVESLDLDGDSDLLESAADIDLEASSAESDSIELDLAELEPSDELDISVNESSAELPEFEEGEVDLASLDEEMEAMSSNMSLANEEFGEDDEVEDFATEFDTAELEVPELSSIETSGIEEGLELDLDSAPEMELSSEPEIELELDSEPDIEPEIDLSAEFESTDLDLSITEDELGAETSDLSSDDLDLAADEPSAEAVTEEFDLAADLGLEAEDLDAQSDEDVFSQALSDIPESESEVELEADSGDSVLSEDDLEAELDFLSDSDEAGTKLDLARAYIDMGDKEGAKDILDEVAQEGNDEQKGQAEELLSRL